MASAVLIAIGLFLATGIPGETNVRHEDQTSVEKHGPLKRPELLISFTYESSFLYF